jgi:Endonuclease-reverse transcriptase
MRRRIPHVRPFCQDSFAHTNDILQCTMFNARSLNSRDKPLHLHALLYSRAFDIVLITETWLNNGTPSSLLDPDNRCNVITCDRQHGLAGGVCAFVSKFLEVVEVPVTQHFPSLEICCFDVLFSCAKCRIFTAYRRPEYDCASVEYMTQLVACLTKFTNTKTPCIIAGDLNSPGVDWVNSVSPSDYVQVKLMEFAIANGFVQAVPERTRLSNTLDIILTNEPAIIYRVAVEAPFTSKFDHFCISLEGIGDGPSELNEQSSLPTKVYLWILKACQTIYRKFDGSICSPLTSRLIPYGMPFAVL